MTLSVVMITKNSAQVMGEALVSAAGLWEEFLVGDAGSSDGTVEIVKRYGGRVIRQSGDNLGKRKQELVAQARGKWILVLDADERVSEKLREEIKRLKDGKTVRQPVAWQIPYQNYVFGKPVYCGGENYAKVRIFRNGFGRISKVPLHEVVEVKGIVKQLKGKIHHHSYRTPLQLFSKFTEYARIAAGEKEIASPGVRRDRDDIVRKLFLYGPHMFWARFVKEKGYKDGWQGFVLAFAFAYMETLTYCILMTQGHPLQKRKG